MSTARIERFFRALESLPSLAAVRAEWEALVGKELPHIEAFMRPRQETAQSYPCPRIPPCGCRHAVVEHASDDIVAVCQCDPPDCGTVSLTHQQIIVYELDLCALAEGIVVALDLIPGFLALDGFTRTCQIGVDCRQEGFRFPVYLTVQVGNEELNRVIEALIVRNDPPFILLTPTSDLWDPTGKHWLAEKRCALFALHDLLLVDSTGHLATGESTRRGLDEFRTAQLPPKGQAKVIPFPTPRGATWSDVRIRFENRDEVHIRVGTIERNSDCRQVGLSNIRNGNPSAQWKLLYEFAERRGTLGKCDPVFSPARKKQCQRLAQSLKAYFGIPGDPIVSTPDGKTWRTRFIISVR